MRRYTVYYKRIKGDAFFLARKSALMYLDKIVRTVKQTFEIDIPPICIIHNPKKI